MQDLALGTVPRYLLLLLVAIVTAALAHLFYKWHRLSHIPGPFGASLSKYWMVNNSLNGRMHSALKDVTDKYGTLVEDS